MNRSRRGLNCSNGPIGAMVHGEGLPAGHGASSHQVLETKFLVSRQGRMGSSSQADAAAHFFAKSAKSSSSSLLQNQLSRQGYNGNYDNELDDQVFPTNFRALLKRCVLPLPQALLHQLHAQGQQQHHQVTHNKERVSVLLQVDGLNNNQGLLKVDERRAQVTLVEPQTIEQQLDPVRSGPKMFAFDGVYEEKSERRLADQALTDAVASVVTGGSDACVFTYGTDEEARQRLMLGWAHLQLDHQVLAEPQQQQLGLLPLAISYVYAAMNQRKATTGAKFSVRVSAAQVDADGRRVTDLLADFAAKEAFEGFDGLNRSPASYLGGVQNDPLAGVGEPRAPTPDKAGRLLDAALARRQPGSHLVFGLHVYQYSLDAGRSTPLQGGRSRLRILDLASPTAAAADGSAYSLTRALLSLFDGRKPPRRESVVSSVLRSCLCSSSNHNQAAINGLAGGSSARSNMGRVTAVIHVSTESSTWSDTLQVLRFASRLHRTRRTRQRRNMASSSRLGVSGASSRRYRSESGSGSDLTPGTSTNASSSEFSCDTVVYRGGGATSDGSATDGEHPPCFGISGRPPPPPPPSVALSWSEGRSRSYRHPMLRGSPGSLDDLCGSARRGCRILTNGAFSVTSGSSVTGIGRSRPSSSLSGRMRGGLPSIPEVTPGQPKMPLNGLVPVQHRPKPTKLREAVIAPRPGETWIDGPSFSKAAAVSPGHVDPRRAEMVLAWVQNGQLDNEEYHAWAQFKTCNDEDDEHNVEGQQPTRVNKMEVAKPPRPAPPPRRTPPREDLEPKRHAKVENGVDESDIQSHPLRILSEENLTVVSSFGGSLVRLQDSMKAEGDNDEEDDDDDAPSKLSLFGIPDQQHIDDDLVKHKFCHEILMMQNGLVGRSASHPDLDEVSPMIITPQNSFLTDISMTGEVPMATTSSTTCENQARQPPSKKFGFGLFKFFHNSSQKDARRAKSCDRKLEEKSGKSRSSSSSPALRLSMFGRKNTSKINDIHQHNVSSGSVKATAEPCLSETPSTMSLATEWEFCNKEAPPSKMATNFDHIMIRQMAKPSAIRPTPPPGIGPTGLRKGFDRKSSGYDSLGGDESSSLDSSQESQSPRLPKMLPTMGRISENESECSNLQLRNNSVNNNHLMNGNHDLNLIQYEEVDILRMDQQRNWRMFRPANSSFHGGQRKKTFTSFS